MAETEMVKSVQDLSDGIMAGNKDTFDGVVLSKVNWFLVLQEIQSVRGEEVEEEEEFEYGDSAREKDFQLNAFARVKKIAAQNGINIPD